MDKLVHFVASMTGISAVVFASNYFGGEPFSDADGAMLIGWFGALIVGYLR